MTLTEAKEQRKQRFQSAIDDLRSLYGTKDEHVAKWSLSVLSKLNFGTEMTIEDMDKAKKLMYNNFEPMYVTRLWFKNFKHNVHYCWIEVCNPFETISSF